MTKMQLCPCHSGKFYAECCQAYHEGRMLPETPVRLMRSRYAAYAMQLPAYIIETTHKDNPHYSQDIEKWSEDILEFGRKTHFKGLEILAHDATTVTFKAILFQGGHNVSFIEKSQFQKVDGRWLYLKRLLD